MNNISNDNRELDPVWQKKQLKIDKMLEKHAESQPQLIISGGVEIDFDYARIEDKSYFVKKALEILKHPVRPADTYDFQWRTNLVRCLERMMGTEFKSTQDLHDKRSYFLAKYKEAEKNKEKDGEQKKIIVRVKSLGRRLKAIRKKLGLTQIQLAEHINTSRRVVVYYEKDERKIPAKIRKWIEKIERLSKKIAVKTYRDVKCT